MAILAYGRMFQPQEFSTDMLFLLLTVPLFGYLGMVVWNRLSQGGLRFRLIEHWAYPTAVSAAIQLLCLYIFWITAGHSLFYALFGPH